MAAITGALGVVFGALVSLHPISASAAALLGFKAETLAGAISSGAVFGMFASMIGIKNSYITNKVNNFYFKLITEQYFTKSPEKEKSIMAQPVKVAEPGYVIEESVSASKSFADSQKRFSLDSVIRAREEGIAAPANVPSR